MSKYQIELDIYKIIGSWDEPTGAWGALIETAIVKVAVCANQAGMRGEKIKQVTYQPSGSNIRIVIEAEILKLK